MTKEDRIIPIILAGGQGTRLWPTSRKSMPKQFCEIGQNGSTFCSTVKCFENNDVFTDPIIVTSDAYIDIVKTQLGSLGIKPLAIIGEPKPLNTGPAIAATVEFCRRFEENKLLFVPSDHKISEQSQFIQSILDASKTIQMENHIVTFGVTPKKASTQYGYICVGDGNQVFGVQPINEFIEKPNKAEAERLIQRKDVLWNSGMFLTRRETILSEFCKLEPKTIATMATAIKSGVQSVDVFRPNAEAFSLAETAQFDKTIMENTDMAAVAVLTDDWLDLGNWGSVWEHSTKDANKNYKDGNVYSHQSQNCMAISNGPAVGIVGLEDIVVVANKDAVLVTNKSNSSGLKSIVQKMAQNDDGVVLRHDHEVRPWGEFASLKMGSNFQVKSIQVQPGGQLSMQYHHHRSEHWVVVHGKPTVTVETEVKQLSPGQSVYIPCGDLHRLENLTQSKVEIIEVQIGDYLGEDDIVRVDDVYNREKRPSPVLA